MSDINTDGVVGSVDGARPIYDPTGIWRLWSVNDIWDGQIGHNKHIPKVGDWVHDPSLPGYQQRVIGHDNVTLVPVLEEISTSHSGTTLTEVDRLLGVSGAREPEIRHAYLDKTKTPYQMTLDQRSLWPGSLIKYVRVFKSSLVTNEGNVISRVYDNAHRLIDDRVGLEKIVFDNHEQVAIQIVRPFHTLENLEDGELITAVGYAADGHVVMKRSYMVENTRFMRHVDMSKKYIEKISLESPFISSTDTDIIRYPLNITLDSLNLTGVVHYSDGSTLRLPVDGTKFRLAGLNSFVSTIVSQTHRLVLIYTMSEGELSQAVESTVNGTITAPYRLIVDNANRSLSVKLFGYPFWIDSANGYQMRWWITNLDRDYVAEVTENVKYGDQHAPFDPVKYGYTQHLSVLLNLRDVNAGWKEFVHSQSVAVSLLNGPIPETTQASWTMRNEDSGNSDVYGIGVYGKLESSNTVKIDCGCSTKEEWLELVYRKTYPLYDQTSESRAPDPTHFRIEYGQIQTVWSIDDWNKALNVASQVASGRTLTITFIKRNAIGDLYLSVGAIMIKPN